MFEPDHVLDGPPFSVKLAFTMLSGGAYEGTGFCVEQDGLLWLITCRHNIEDRNSHFTGVSDLDSFSIVGGNSLELHKERAIAGISIDGFIPDCAAISITRDEWGSAPIFGAETAISFNGPPLPDKFGIKAPAPQDDTGYIKPIGWVVYQGYPGGHTLPVTLRGVRAHCLPHFIQPWMIVSLPTTTNGFSGGPLLNVTNDSMSLLGIITHKFMASFDARLEDGRSATIGLEASAAMPISPLLWAIKDVGGGVSITNIPAPLHWVPTNDMA